MPETPSTASMPAPDAPVIQTENLQLASGLHLADITVPAGLTLAHVSREASATVLALTLAGRMKPKQGTIQLNGSPVRRQQLFREIALAGATPIDTLERIVSARTIVREQLAWSQPFYRRIPRHPEETPQVKRAFELTGLDLDLDTTVGTLDVGTRIQLRTALALIARPEATLCIIDDIDQLRSNRLREAYLQQLQELSTHLPVLAISANDGPADTIIRIDATGETA